MSVSRRQFLRRAGVGLAAAGGGKGILGRLTRAGRAHAARPGPEGFVYTTCGICAGGCGMKAYVRDGLLVKLEGNPDCESSGGKLCGKGQAGIGFLYDPDRLRYPLARTNPRKGAGEDPGFERISWDEALDLVASKMSGAIESHGPKSVLYLGKRRANDLMAAIGSPNVVTHNSTCNVTSVIGHRHSFGGPTAIADLDRCRYLLSFGWDMPGKGKVFYTRRYADFLEREGTKAVCLDPMLSYTASKADEWIPVRPGGDLPVALAMINVIIREGLHDRDYVERYTTGFEEVRDAVGSFTPEWAEKESDVSAAVIIRLARELATMRPAAIPVYKRHYNVRRGNFSLVQATNILVAITGGFEVAGGIVLSRRLPLGSAPPRKTPPPIDPAIPRIDGADDPAFDTRLRPFGMQQTLPDALLRDEPYEIRFCMVNNQSLFSFADVQKATRALAKIPFLVNVNVLPDEMAMLADVVLPESTYLETSGIVASTAQLRGQIKARQPVIPTLHDTRSFEAMKTALAERLGLADYIAPIGEEALDARLAPLGITFEELKRMGVHTVREDFRERDKESLGTPDGKIQLAWSGMSRHDYPTVPHYREAYGRRPTRDYPFYVVTTRSALNRHCATANIEWIKEACPENGLVMNAAKARELGIREGERVRVSSKVGEIVLRASLTEGVRPDTVCVAHGFGQWSRYLRVAFGRGANTGDILPSFDLAHMIEAKDPSGNAADNEIFVRVERA